MGGLNSTLADRSGTPNFLVVERRTACPRGGVGIADASKPSGLNGVDSLLWEELVREVDPLARTLNRGLLASTILYVIVLGITVGVGMTLPTLQAREKYGPTPQPWLIAFWVAIPLHTFCLLWIYEVNNRRVDRRIKQTMETLRYRFEGAGYEMKYLTQHTGLCKPKHARSERIIAFYPKETHAVENGSQQQPYSNSANSGNGNRITPTSLLPQQSPSRPLTNSSAPPKVSSLYEDIEAGLARGTEEPSLVNQLKQDGELYSKY